MCGSVRAVCCALAGAGPDTLDPPALRLALAALALMTSAAEADLTSYQVRKFIICISISFT